MKAKPSQLALPLAALFAVCFIAPLVLLLGLSVNLGAEGAPGLSLAHYARFFGDRFNLSILWDTLALGVKATALCLLFGFPMAWVCARASARWQSVLVFLVILPVLTSVVVRTFSWIVILGSNGILNKILLAAGLIDEPLKLLFTEWGLVIVLAQVQMPLMVLPILTVLSKIDPNLGDASRALGAGEWRTLWRVTVPLALPGIVAGCILTYAATVTAFITQTLIGGARHIYMPLAIFQQAIGANDWPFAAALSVVFMVAVLLVVVLLGWGGQRLQGGVRA